MKSPTNTNTPEEDFEMTQIAKNNSTQLSHVTFNTPENLNLSFTTTETISTSGARQLDITVIDNAIYDYDELPNNGDNLMFGGADKCEGQVPESDYNELLKRFDHMCDLHSQLSTITQLLMHDGVDVEKLLNIGTDGYNMPYSKDYMDWRKHTITALTNVINVGEGKCKEWPCVGSKVTWGECEIIGTVKCIDNGWAWILCPDGKYTQQGVKYLKPQLTKCEIIKCEIIELIDCANELDWNDDTLANAFFERFNITKKPQ